MKIKAISLLLLAAMGSSLNAMEGEPNLAATSDFYLTYMDMGKGFCGKSIENTHAMKSNISNILFNLVFTEGNKLSDQDIEAVKQYMGKTQFVWLVSPNQEKVKDTLELNGFTSNDEGTDTAQVAMSVDLTNYNSDKIEEMLKNGLTSKKTTDIELWTEISAQGFGNTSQELASFLEYIKGNADRSAFSFYTASLNGITASSCLMIEHPEKKVASLHLVSTIEECRNERLAQLVSLRAMYDAKMAGCTHMILLATPRARSLYLGLGFQYCKKYALFVPKSDIADLTRSMIGMQIGAENTEKNQSSCTLF